MNKKRKKLIIIIFIVICITLMIYSIINIAIWYISNKRDETINEEIKEIINKPVSDDKSEKTIDFKTLREKNKDIVAYLKVNNTNIDHVVVKGNDNSYYLKHNLYKQYSVFGAIFVDYRNKLDGSDKNLIIYGHNTANGSMFGTLRNVITKKWYENEENHTINLIFEDKILTYQVFSTYSIRKEDYYITTKFKNNSEFNKFVNTLKKRSVYDYGISVNGEDSILTLSTCTGGGKSRMVLHAKLIKSNI